MSRLDGIAARVRLGSRLDGIAARVRPGSRLDGIADRVRPEHWFGVARRPRHWFSTARRPRLTRGAMTISRRLVLAAATAVAVAVAIASVGAYFAVKAKLIDEVDSSLQQRAQVIQRFAPSAATGEGPGTSGNLPGRGGGPLARVAGGAGARGTAGTLPPPPQAIKRFGGAVGVVQLVTPGGAARRPRGQTGTALPIDAATRAVARGKAAGSFQDETVDGHRLRVLSAPLAHGGAVEVALPLGEVDSTLSGLIALLAAITAGGVALAALLGLLVARTALKPVRRFTRRTEEIASQREPLGQRLAVDSRDELGRLARSYNSTLDALERSVAAQRQLVSDASHELRTPLTSLRANLEVLMAPRGLPAAELRELNGDLVDQVDELTRLVEEIVELARSGEQPVCFLELPLADVVLGALEQVRPHAPSLAFEVDAEHAGVVRCDPERLTRAVRNLLENAVKWSPPGGVVEVKVDGGAVEVRDHGPGFDPEDLPHVFERFYRARDSRRLPGSGLGLAIVRQVADAHGASVSAANAAGGGAYMRLVLAETAEPRDGHAGDTAGVAGTSEPVAAAVS